MLQVHLQALLRQGLLEAHGLDDEAALDQESTHRLIAVQMLSNRAWRQDFAVLAPVDQ